MLRSQRCVWPFTLIDRAVHCSDCLGHYLCYRNCACHVLHTKLTWFVLALLDYENLCQWVVGLPRALRIAQHITQRKDKT